MTWIVSFENNVPRILNSKKGWLALLTSGNFILNHSFVTMISWRQGLKEKWYCRCFMVFPQMLLQVPKMEVLNLIRPFCGWAFPCISRIYTAYIGEDFRFGYLKCLVTCSPLLPEKTRVSGISKKFPPRLVSETETISSPHNSPPPKPINTKRLLAMCWKDFLGFNKACLRHIFLASLYQLHPDKFRTHDLIELYLSSIEVFTFNKLAVLEIHVFQFQSTSWKMDLVPIFRPYFE